MLMTDTLAVYYTFEGGIHIKEEHSRAMKEFVSRFDRGFYRQLISKTSDTYNCGCVSTFSFNGNGWSVTEPCDSHKRYYEALI